MTDFQGNKTNQFLVQFMTNIIVKEILFSRFAMRLLLKVAVI